MCRGTPSAPGRTVTLEPDEAGSVPGAAYLLAGDLTEQRTTLSVSLSSLFCQEWVLYSLWKQ